MSIPQQLIPFANNRVNSIQCRAVDEPVMAHSHPELRDNLTPEWSSLHGALSLTYVSSWCLLLQITRFQTVTGLRVADQSQPTGQWEQITDLQGRVKPGLHKIGNAVFSQYHRSVGYSARFESLSI
jgi:hypothetical protein